MLGPLPSEPALETHHSFVVAKFRAFSFILHAQTQGWCQSSYVSLSIKVNTCISNNVSKHFPLIFMSATLGAGRCGRK